MFAHFPKNLGPQLERALRVRTPVVVSDPCRGGPKYSECSKVLEEVPIH